MNQRKEIAKRIAALRIDLGLTPAEVAEKTGVSGEEFRSYEEGTADIPMGWLSMFSRQCGISITNLLTGSGPHAQVYHLTRKGTGPVVERRHEYHYEGLAAQFAGKTMEPFVVTVELRKDAHISLNAHPGEEFNYVLSGRLLVRIDGHDLELEAGDSIYFDSSKKHGMAALDGEPASFLAILSASREVMQ